MYVRIDYILRMRGRHVNVKRT